MKKKGEGLTGNYRVEEDEQIFEFLERERKKRKENERRQKTLQNTVIVGRTKPMPSVFHKTLKPKKTLAEIWEAEDQERREWSEDEADRKRQQTT